MTITPATLAAIASDNMDNIIAASTPGGIERQEREGQAAMVRASDRLPIDMGRRITREMVTAETGITFGEPMDDIFVAATLPDGWIIKPTDHSMWSDLIDNKGRKRAGIFYKAAFYDRSAHMTFDCRYVSRPIYGDDTRTLVITDRATGQDIHTVGTAKETDYETFDKHDTQAREWLATRYPNHVDPFAYWG